jgi:hypothetical protein
MFEFPRISLAGLRSRKATSLVVRRFEGNPIIRPEMLPDGDGDNINGPSLVRVPDWVPGKMGEYYLYFAHHLGTYIRLAFADRLDGPWRVHEPGTLHLADLDCCRDHIASPDVHVDHDNRQFRMFFHGRVNSGKAQRSFLALSKDGIHFTQEGDAIGNFYLRVTPWEGAWIGMAKGGVMYRSQNGLTGFERLPRPAFRMKDENANSAGSVRHVAMHVKNSILFVYHSRIGDAPESLLRSEINLAAPPERWRGRATRLICRPETDYEGADLPVRESRAGASRTRERALRDPAIFIEGDRTFLLYSVAGESGIAIAELTEKAGSRWWNTAET